MKDSDYNELKLKVTICPEQVRWPTQFTHWERLHRVVNEARERVGKAYAPMDEVDANSDLTAEGKSKERAKLAERAAADFGKSSALSDAQTAVSQMQQRWAAKIDEVIKPAEDHVTAVMYAQIRDRISALDEKSRLGFIDKHIDDPAVVSAVLSAPEFLSGCSPVEFAVVKQKLAKRVLSPEVAEAKDSAEKALAAGGGAGAVAASR